MFKKDIHEKMNDANNSRKKWACEKLQNFQNTSKDKKPFIQDAQTQIEAVYNQYKNDIAYAYKHCDDIEVEYFCFSNLVDTYPKLDYENTKKEMNIEDNYTLLIKNLSVKIDIPE